MMFDLDLIVEDTEKYVKDLNSLLDFSDLTVQRNESVSEILDVLKRLLNTCFTDCTRQSQFRRITNRGTFWKQFERFEDLFGLADFMVRSLANYSREIERGFIPRMKEMSCEQGKAAAEIRSKLKSLRVSENGKVNSVKEVQAKVAALHSKIANEKRRTKTISAQSISNYRAIASDYRKEISELNRTHVETVEEIKILMNVMKGRLITREAHLKSFILSVYPLMLQIMEHCEAAENNFKQKQNAWLTGFRRFIAENGIVRTSLTATKFTPFNFSFANPTLARPLAICDVGRDCIIPLATAEIAHEVLENPRNPTELACAVGDRVYIFEPIREDGAWIYAETSDRKRKGFVPSASLKLIEDERKVVFTKEAQIPVNDECSTCELGVMLHVKEEKENGLLCCEAINGDQVSLYSEHTIDL